jgi:hypothetical protein
MVSEMHDRRSQPDEAGTKRRQWRLLLLIVGILATITVAIFGFPVGFVIVKAFHDKSQMNRLLNDVDHIGLVVAVHQMLEGERFAGQEVTYLRGSDLDLPPEIRSLKPIEVSVHAREVGIHFGSGFHHFGFLVLRQDEEPDPSQFVEYTEMSDGIWFFENE